MVGLVMGDGRAVDKQGRGAWADGAIVRAELGG